MKHGILFFFNMGNLTMIARIAFLPFVMMVFRTNPEALFFPIYIALAVICFLLCFVHAPSDKAVRHTLKRFHEDVKEKLKDDYGFRRDESIVYFSGYRKSGKMRLRRRLDHDVVYPYPTVLIHAARSDKRAIIVAQKSLIKPIPTEYIYIDLDKVEDLQVTSLVEEDNDKIAAITVSCALLDEPITVYAKNDYHYRDFMAAMK